LRSSRSLARTVDSAGQVAMLDVFCIFLLYAVQGTVQGAIFGSLPLLLRQNPSATDVDQSHFSIVGYPFTMKFLIAPLVDGIYFARLGRRESWLLPLQLLSASMLVWLASHIAPMLESSPPEVATLSRLLFVLVSATAAGDIATDAWANCRMSDSRASVCQALGLTVGIQASSAFFFFLKGKGFVDVSVLFFFILQMFLGGHEGDVEDEEAVGVGEVLHRVRTFCGVPNVRWWLLFSLLIPVLSGHDSVLAVRYQALGFTPEIFSEYDLYLIPVSFIVMWLGGWIAQTPRPMSTLAWIFVLQVMLSLGVQAHFWQSRQIGQAAVEDRTMRAIYVCLKQLSEALGTIVFVIRMSIFNRIAQNNQAIAGTVITFLASVSNLGGMLPGTWAPLVVEAIGIDALAATCLGVGLSVLVLYRGKLRRMDDLQDAGWLGLGTQPHQD